MGKIALKFSWEGVMQLALHIQQLHEMHSATEGFGQVPLTLYGSIRVKDGRSSDFPTGLQKEEFNGENDLPWHNLEISLNEHWKKKQERKKELRIGIILGIMQKMKKVVSMKIILKEEKKNL